MRDSVRALVRSGGLRTGYLRGSLGLLPLPLSWSLFILTACGNGVVEVTDPDPGDGGSAALTVHATLAASHADLATALGWQAGVPGAQVRVHKTLEPYDGEYWITGQTDASGTVTFPDLLNGLYEVVITRPLTGDEAAKAESTRVVAGGRWLNAPRQGTADIPLTPNQPKGLVFSELALTVPLPWETGGGSYHGAKYIELFNNSDATVYLDGMILGVAWDFYTDIAGYWTCDVSAPFRMDPEGIWTGFSLRFPGSGADYPVAPGATVLIARSAVDHTSAHPSLSDLSPADFEFPTGGEAGNPDVPNLVELGPNLLNAAEPNNTYPLFLSERVDLAALPVRSDPIGGREYRRFPGSQIVDAVLMQWDFTKSSFSPSPFCNQALDPSFEALPGPALWSASDGAAWTAQRRAIGYEGGRPILQDTNTSMADFVRAWKTPGVTPASGPGGP